MVWRWLSVVSLVVGCSADVAPAISSTGPQALPQPSPVGLVASVPAASEAIVPPQPAELCFRVDAELDAAIPTARERLIDAAEAWRRPIRFGDDCPIRFGYEVLPQVNSGNGWPWPFGRGLPHESLIVSKHWIDNGQLVDKSPADCQADEALLLSVLIHELGHVLNLGHMPKGSGGAMEQGYSDCEVLFPSEIEIEAAATR
jgi:hypothetical protein